jgi:3-deoxy-D-manno-octulosonate 8-phosphate phosphatase (KDO 8-P phosphatase)
MKRIQKKISKKAKKIKLLILDVDGVLTDGSVFIDDDNKEIKAFNIYDGLGMKMLQRSGVEIAIISGGIATAVEHRALRLGIKYIFLGQERKLTTFLELKRKLNLDMEQIAYVGDDIPDFHIMKQVGLSCAVRNSVKEILKIADYITQKDGGLGAVREVCELIMYSQGTFKEQMECYNQNQLSSF